MHVDRGRHPLARTEAAGVVGHVIKISVERAAGERRPQILNRRKVLRQQVNRSAKRRGPNGGRRSRRAVKVDSAQELRGEKCPRVMRRRVRVVERNAVEVDVVIAIREAAEVGLRLAQTHAVAVQRKCGWRHAHHRAVVGNRRAEVADEGLGNLGARRSLSQQRIQRRQRRSHRSRFIRFHRNLFRHVAQRQRNRQFRRLSGAHLHARLLGRGKACGIHLHGVLTRRQAGEVVPALAVGGRLLRHAGRVVLHADGCARQRHAAWIQHGSGYARA